MTMKELDRYHVIKQVISKKLKQTEAGRELNISTRQVRRLVKRIKAMGPAGVIHGLRGKSSNNKLSEQLTQKVKKLVSTTYNGFGPTLTAEKLEERDGLIISVSALRERMIATGEWEVKKQKPRHRKCRDRRSRFGELIQVDGSPHKWFEDRGEACNLINFVDDANSGYNSSGTFDNSLTGVLQSEVFPLAADEQISMFIGGWSSESGDTNDYNKFMCRN